MNKFNYNRCTKKQDQPSQWKILSQVKSKINNLIN